MTALLNKLSLNYNGKLSVIFGIIKQFNLEWKSLNTDLSIISHFVTILESILFIPEICVSTVLIFTSNSFLNSQTTRIQICMSLTQFIDSMHWKKQILYTISSVNCTYNEWITTCAFCLNCVRICGPFEGFVFSCFCRWLTSSSLLLTLCNGKQFFEADIWKHLPTRMFNVWIIRRNS